MSESIQVDGQKENFTLTDCISVEVPSDSLRRFWLKANSLNSNGRANDRCRGIMDTVNTHGILAALFFAPDRSSGDRRRGHGASGSLLVIEDGGTPCPACVPPLPPLH